ncbi:hypothetical protein HKX48_001631 [Thoreauomyces humboldtii]|nr:hypothetical protein HKX48_001631 [Thoreauomyces humboldtii]
MQMILLAALVTPDGSYTLNQCARVSRAFYAAMPSVLPRLLVHCDSSGLDELVHALPGSFENEFSRYHFRWKVPVAFLRNQFPVLLHEPFDKPLLPPVAEHHVLVLARDIKLASYLSGDPRARTRRWIRRVNCDRFSCPIILAPVPELDQDHANDVIKNVLLDLLGVRTDFMPPRYTLARLSLHDESERQAIVDAIEDTFKVDPYVDTDVENGRDDERRWKRRVRRFRQADRRLMDFIEQNAVAGLTSRDRPQRRLLRKQRQVRRDHRLDVLERRHGYSKKVDEHGDDYFGEDDDYFFGEGGKEDVEDREDVRFDIFTDSDSESEDPYDEEAELDKSPAHHDHGKGFWSDGEEAPLGRAKRRIKERSVSVCHRMLEGGATHVLFLEPQNPEHDALTNWVFFQRGSGQNLLGRMWRPDRNFWDTIHRQV